jgi:hypothetical protein
MTSSPGVFLMDLTRWLERGASCCLGDRSREWPLLEPSSKLVHVRISPLTVGHLKPSLSLYDTHCCAFNQSSGIFPCHYLSHSGYVNV